MSVNPRGIVRRLAANGAGLPRAEYRTRAEALFQESEWGWIGDMNRAYVFPVYDGPGLSATGHAKRLADEGIDAHPIVWSQQKEA